MLRETRFEALSQRASRAFGRGALVSLGLAAVVLAATSGTVAASEAPTAAPVPEECQNPNLSAAEQARCDFIARTPDLCLRSGLSEETQRFCDELDAACPWQQDDRNDEVGASKTQTPEKALQAIQLVETGHVYGLAQVYDEETIPLPFGREFDVEVSFFTVPPFTQHVHEGRVDGHLPQVGTQFDALGHQGHPLGFYNCLSQDDVGPDELGRLRKLGVETVRPFFTRGVLLDFVNHSSAPKMRFRGQVMLADSYVITLEDIEEVLRNEEVAEPGKGDVVLFYTGWDALFGVQNERAAFSPGPGIEVADWLASKEVALVGADTKSVEPLVADLSAELVDDPEPFGPEIGALFNVVHFILLTENGIHLFENMRLNHLAGDLLEAFEDGLDSSPYEFLFTYAPVPIKGLDGSPGQPLAVR